MCFLLQLFSSVGREEAFVLWTQRISYLRPDSKKKYSLSFVKDPQRFATKASKLTFKVIIYGCWKHELVTKCEKQLYRNQKVKT